MKTASWFTWRGPGRIGISVGTPRGVVGGYRLFRPLNPTRPMLTMERSEYEARYAAILADLDARTTWDQLHALAGDAEPVLLCFERPPFSPTNSCHRRLVADWFKFELGEGVPEYDPKDG
jgi:hypothetical protein